MREKIFIGVAWPYANGSLHLGHIAGCLLPADIFARFSRMKGKDVLMVSGSDEHGTPITISAEKEKVTPQEIVDRFNAEHIRDLNDFGISFDLFTRTTENNHTIVVHDVFKKLCDEGHVYKKEVESFYCSNCDRFLADRYIGGVCPHCKCENARGDQCDECGKILNPEELLEVRCNICSGIPEIKSTDHLFLALSSFENDLKEWIKGKTYWKSSVLKFTENWLNKGLEDRAITRDIQWGITVPIFGFEDKRIYVWFDAVIGYLSASKEWSNIVGDSDKWKEWWFNKKAKHYYFLAKDNIPFHSIIWPSILMGYDRSLNLPYEIPANEYLCLKGEQFSKSRGILISVSETIKNLDVDAIRYYLSINMPENRDSNWLWDDFIAKNNDELVGTYGNFIHRVLTFTQKNFGNIPELGKIDDLDRDAINKIKLTSDEASSALSNCLFKKALRSTMNLAQFGNFYFDRKQPWNLIKTDSDKCKTTLHICLKIVKALSIFIYPYLPFSSKIILSQLGEEMLNEKINWDDVFIDLKVNFKIKKPKPLFKKLLLEDFMQDADPFSKLDLRVAKIIKVKDHPQADKLYLLNVDLGDLGKRVIVAGMKPHYKKDELVDKKIVMVINLKPAVIRGVKSNGMLLAANDENGIVSLLNPKGSQPGSKVFIENIKSESNDIIEFDEFKKIELFTNDKQEVLYRNKILRTNDGVITTDKEVQKGSKIS